VKQLTSLIEAALFSAANPLTLGELRKLDREAEKAAVVEALEELKETYASRGHGVELVEVAEGYQVVTRPEHAEAIQRAHLVSRPRKLSPAAMETLAIVAYRQPVGRAEVEEIRGVNADGVLRSLQERGLVEPVERGEGLGRPLLYGTTPAFLELLGLKEIGALPRLEELSVELAPPPQPVLEE
jgi:segregation and condensation protein B